MEIQSLLQFLTNLQENNHKDWFDLHKKEYDQLRADWIQLAANIIKQTSDFDDDVTELDPKKCIFRINRDVRFSKNKAPYKNNFGISLSKGGKNGDFCGYYIHLQPGESFIAGGSYQPMPDKLAAIRQEIDYNLEEFKSIITHKEFVKHFGALTGDKLQRPPKGYDAENPAIEYIKHKGFLAFLKIDDKNLTEKELLKHCLSAFKAMKPLNDFLNRAILG
jgi:uncharacterized protein (TIGR02453 family)